MKSNITLGKWEMVALMVNAVITQVFLNLPRTMVETASTAGWVVSIYIGIIAMVLFLIIAWLYKGFEGKDMVDIGELVGGSIGRIVTGFIFLVQIWSVVSVTLRDYGEDMKVISYNNSPISFIILFFLAGMLFSAFMGIEAIARFHLIIIPIIIFGLVAILAGVSPYFDIANITPVLGNGTRSILWNGFPKVSTFSSLITLFLLAPFVKTARNFKSSGIWAIIISGLAITVSTFVFELVYSYPSAVESFIPIYQLARIINYGRFFQRIESVFLFVWAASAMLYLSMAFFVSLYVFKKMFKLEYYKPLIVPLAVIFFALSMLPNTLMDAVKLETVYFRNIAWITTFIFVIILLATARVMKKNKRKEQPDR